MSAPRARTANVSGDEKCARCGDEGVVIVGTEVRADVAYDQAGPCPLCERGFRVEHGIGCNADGSEKIAKRPPWGREGYWRGRPPLGLA